MSNETFQFLQKYKKVTFIIITCFISIGQLRHPTVAIVLDFGFWTSLAASALNVSSQGCLYAYWSEKGRRSGLEILMRLVAILAFGSVKENCETILLGP